MAEFDPDAFLAKREKRGGFDPDAFLAKTAPQPSAQSVLGGTESSAAKVASRAALADTLLNAVTSTWDLAARVPATAYHYATGPKGETFGQAYERAAEEVARTAPIKPDLVGRTLGITNTPQYSGALQRQAAEAIAPVIQQNVLQPVAEITGLPEGAVADIGAIATIPLAGPTGRAVTAVAKPVVGAVKAAPRAVADVAGGFTGAVTGKTVKPGAIPEPWEQASVRQPVSNTYYTPEQLQAWRRGEISTDQLIPQPIENLGPEALKALSRTQGNVPYAAQGFRAFGEQLGETYRNPLNLLTDVGLDVLTGGGLPTMGRLGYKGYQGIQNARAAKTLERAGFSPMFPEEFAALERGLPHPSVIGPVPPTSGGGGGFPVPQTQPLLPYSPAGQTAMPMPGPGRRVNIEGETFNLPYEINTSQVQTARPQPTVLPVRPTAEAPAQPAVTTQPVKPLIVAEDVGKTPEQLAADQAILDLINARRGVQAEPAPSPTPEPKKRISQEQRIREREAEMTPEQLAAQEAEVERQLAKSRGTKTEPAAKTKYASPAEMRKDLYGKMSNDELEALVNKTFPSVESLKQKMGKSTGEENKAMDENLRKRLEALGQKYKKPKDAMEMMTGDIPENSIPGLINDPTYNFTGTLHKHGNFANPLTVEEAIQRKALHQFGMGGDLDYNIIYKTNDGKNLILNQYEKIPGSAEKQLAAKSIAESDGKNKTTITFKQFGKHYDIAYHEIGKEPVVITSTNKPNIWLSEFSNDLPKDFKMPTTKQQFYDVFGSGKISSKEMPKLKNYEYDADMGQHFHGLGNPLDEMTAKMRGRIQSASRPNDPYSIDYKKDKNIIKETSFPLEGETTITVRHPDGSETIYTEMKFEKMYSTKQLDKNGNIINEVQSNTKPSKMPNILGK